MKKYIISLIFLMGITNFLYSFDDSKVEFETGNFYFLVGTEGNERAIMYLHIVGTNAYGSYYTESHSIEFDEYGNFDGKNLKLGYGREWDSDKEKYINQKYIMGTLSDDIVFRGKHNSKNVNLSLANTPINTMKIFSCSYDESLFTEIIPLKDYNESKLINNYNSKIEEYKEELKDYPYVYSATDKSISYIDDKIIIIHSGFHGRNGLGGQYDGESFDAYNINSKFEYGNEIKLSDFIANPKDRRLLSLIRDKFYQYYNSDDFQGGIGVEEYDFDSLIAEQGGIEYYDFLISPQGMITILAPYNINWGSQYLLEATFTFEELKPFIKKNSALDYLFN